MKWLLAALVAGAGAAGALLAGASLFAVLMATLAGAGAAALVPRARAMTARPPPIDEEAEAAAETGALTDAIDEPLMVVRDRRVLLANRAAKALLGAHIEGSDVRLAIRHPAAAAHLGDGEEAAPARMELVGLGALGQPWEMVVAPLPDGSRLVRLTDLSRERAAEEIRVNFVANASHELRTPLATLLGYLETLQEDVDAETRDRFIAIMHGEARRMRDLIDDLMSLSRIEADRYAPPRDRIDLLPLIDEVRKAVKPLLAGRKILVSNRARGTLVIGDRGQLVQMLDNLVANALKYGRPESPVRVELADAGPDLLSVTVIDEGEGIAAEHVPRLTERFYRVDAGRSRQIGGTGLGLAIVKHIVLRHRGRLEIESRIGEGTEVRVVLPRATDSSQS